ncbi:uncharacterized protein LOC8278901 [Ricinus communis]|uniref:Uncharacterized protein n=1 Tax=Ricinus communis TaxID=3988 RepID=B9R7F5_RICCO|nr:uncharacterized protein LOC8278901 [Ricinus communis]EEF52435.1 conserved hypothetical protein [Ricinus communis]|eukprot:XP_002510248.1 uncharacterized protein LOC8278901 [Ricinus communis]
MGVFHHEDPPTPPKKCKFLAAALKDAFSNCSTCRRLSISSPEEEHPTSDIDDEQELIVSAIRSRAMEKSRNRSFVLTDSFSWVFSPRTGELYLAPKIFQQKDDDGDDENNDDEDDEREEFLSVGSCFSCCSSALSKEAFVSMKTNFSRCSSLSDVLEIKDFPRRSILEEFCHCEGWPFGLCRKAVLLPPLPKSPSESWSWSKGSKIVKMARVSTFPTGLGNHKIKNRD